MRLTAKHKHLIEMLADPLDMDTNKAKAKRAGLSECAMYRMLKDPEAIELLNRRTYELIPTATPEAYRCLVRQLRSNDTGAAKAYLQTRGDIGSGGHTSNITVTQTNSDESLDDAITRAQLERRETILQDKE